MGIHRSGDLILLWLRRTPVHIKRPARGLSRKFCVPSPLIFVPLTQDNATHPDRPAAKVLRLFEILFPGFACAFIVVGFFDFRFVFRVFGIFGVFGVFEC